MRLAELDSELYARTPSPAVRTTSRRLGRQALRAGRLIWPNATLEALAPTMTSPHQPFTSAVRRGRRARARRRRPGRRARCRHRPRHRRRELLGFDPFTVRAALDR